MVSWLCFPLHWLYSLPQFSSKGSGCESHWPTWVTCPSLNYCGGSSVVDQVWLGPPWVQGWSQNTGWSESGDRCFSKENQDARCRKWERGRLSKQNQQTLSSFHFLCEWESLFCQMLEAAEKIKKRAGLLSFFENFKIQWKWG